MTILVAAGTPNLSDCPVINMKEDLIAMSSVRLTRLVLVGAFVLLPTLAATPTMCLPTAQKMTPSNWQTEYKAGTAIVRNLADTDFSKKENQGYEGQKRLERLAHGAELRLRAALEAAQSKQAKEQDIANILMSLGQSLIWQKRTSEAKSLILSAKALREKHYPKQSVEVADCSLALVGIAQSEQRQNVAEDLAIDAYNTYMKLLPYNDPRFCDVLPVIGAYTRDRKEAAAYYKQFVAATEKKYGKTSKELLLPMSLCAATLANNHQHADSAKMYERIVALRKIHPPTESYETIPTDRVNMQRQLASGKLSYHKCSEDEPNVDGRRTQLLAGKAKSASIMIEQHRPSAREKYDLFDNMSMDKALQHAESLAASNDLAAAKIEWTRVLNFMNDPGWFPTAAVVPIVKRFTSLAETCIGKQQFEDADNLIRGAIKFPFHSKGDEVLVDGTAEKLFNQLSKTDVSRCRSFLMFAMERVDETRKSKYQGWMNALPPQEHCE